MTQAPKPSAAPPPAIVPWGATPARELPGTGWMFVLYLTVIAIEYGGLTGILPVLGVLRVSTVFAYLLAILLVVRLGRGAVVGTRQGKILLFLTIFTAASIVWAVVQTHVVTTFRYMCDYLGLFLTTAYLVDRPSRIKKLSIVGTLVVILLLARNADLLTSSAGAERLVRFRTSYFMGDGNDFAWGIMTFLTFPLFLMLSRSGLLWRALGAVGAASALIIVVLTQSRGGALALGGAVVFYAFVLSKRKVVSIAAVAVMIVVVWAFAPAQFRNRMETIQDYQEDGSAQGRIRAWKAATRMAFEYPLGVGAGNFSSAYGRYYRPDDLTGWAANRWISAHSVYFKTLGEYGFIGAGAFIGLIIITLVDNRRSLRICREVGPTSTLHEAWPGALSVGLIGYAVGGVFLGGVTYPHLFILTGLAVSARRLALAAGEAAGAPGHVVAEVMPSRGEPIRPSVRPRGRQSLHPVPAARSGSLVVRGR
jgi:probable O-glycosylation ligase (exosortase A-associated)